MNIRLFLFSSVLFLCTIPISAGLDDLVFPTHSSITFRQVVTLINIKKQSYEPELNTSELEDLAPKILRRKICEELTLRSSNPTNMILLSAFKKHLCTPALLESLAKIFDEERAVPSTTLPRTKGLLVASPLSPRRSAGLTPLLTSPHAMPPPPPHSSPCEKEEEKEEECATYLGEPLKMSRDLPVFTFKDVTGAPAIGFSFPPKRTEAPTGEARSHLMKRINSTYNLTYADTMLYLAKTVHFFSEDQLQLSLSDFKGLLYIAISNLPETDENVFLCSLLSPDFKPPRHRIQQIKTAALIHKILVTIGKEASTEEGYAGDDDSDAGE